MAIKIEELCKEYRGKKVINMLSLDIPNGTYGLLGHNGAGKTTLLRILSTLIPKSHGKITINGTELSQVKKIRKIVGYLPQNFDFYPGLTVLDTMKYFCALAERDKKSSDEIPLILEKVNLSDRINCKVKTLSGGMKRRLGMAVTMIANPEVYLIDEPTAGLDPEERIRLRKLITELSHEKTVVLSTHITEDIEETCDKLAIIHEGSITYAGGMSNLLDQVKNYVWEMQVEKNYLEQALIEKGAYLISRVGMKDMDRIRVVSKMCPESNAYNVIPKLEDAFVCVENKMV